MNPEGKDGSRAGTSREGGASPIYLTNERQSASQSSEFNGQNCIQDESDVENFVAQWR